MSDEKFDLDKYLEEKTQPIEKPSEVISGGGAGRGFVNPPTVEDLNKSEAELERKKIAAGVGAATGAVLRHKGVEVGNVLGAGKNVYQPSEENIKKINLALRQKTGDPTIDVRGLTPEQVERILSGGKGPELGTSGRQRAEGFNLESARRARHQQNIERYVDQVFPGTRNPLAHVSEPFVPLESNIVVPQSTATNVAQKQTKEQLNALEEAQRKARLSGVKSGAAKLGAGAIGGALTGFQGVNMATQKEPIDWQQYLSLLGNLGMTFGGARLGTLGGLAQIPYAVKHREEIARGMGLGEINPTVFGGAPEALETPIGSAMGNR